MVTCEIKMLQKCFILHVITVYLLHVFNMLKVYWTIFCDIISRLSTA